MAAEAEHHHKGPGFAQLSGLWVEQLAGVAEVDLGFFTSRQFSIRPYASGCLEFERAHEATDSGITALIAALFQAFPNSHHLDALSAQLEDLGTKGLDWWRPFGEAQGAVRVCSTKRWRSSSAGSGPVSNPCWAAQAR